MDNDAVKVHKRAKSITHKETIKIIFLTEQAMSIYVYKGSVIFDMAGFDIFCRANTAVEMEKSALGQLFWSC